MPQEVLNSFAEDIESENKFFQNLMDEQRADELLSSMDWGYEE